MMRSLAEWTASIPDELTLRDALVFVDQALADAKEAEAIVLERYTGGTLPPPPWPKHPELVTALDTMDGGRTLINRGIDMGHGDDKFRKSDPRALPLLNAGRMLYREIGVMLDRDKRGEVTLPNLPQLAAAAARKALPTVGGGLLALAVVLWVIHEMGDE